MYYLTVVRLIDRAGRDHDPKPWQEHRARVDYRDQVLEMAEQILRLATRYQQGGAELRIDNDQGSRWWMLHLAPGMVLPVLPWTVDAINEDQRARFHFGD